MPAAVRLCHPLGLLMVLGCTPVVGEPAPPEPAPPPPVEPEPEPEPVVSSAGGRIDGAIKHSVTKAPIVNALVILQCTCLDEQPERFTNDRGIYSFSGLPEGNYTIQVLAGTANVSKMTQLPEAAKFRANFAIDPEAERGPVTIIIENAGLPNGPGTEITGCFFGGRTIKERRNPIYFRTTVGNSLRDAVEAGSYGSAW